MGANTVTKNKGTRTERVPGGPRGIGRSWEFGELVTGNVNNSGETYGASARTGGGVVRVPGTLVRRDGLIDRARLRQIANMANTTGFLISPVHGYEVRTGWAVAARRDRERMVGDRVTGADVMEYVRDNADMLTTPGVLLCAVRDRRTGVTYLCMVTVVHTVSLARHLARVNETGWFVDVQSGRTTKVPAAA